MFTLRRVTHVATGKAKVDRVAGNRRVNRDATGKVLAMRGSACTNPKLRELPEGTPVAVDGAAGTVVVRPDEAEAAEHESRRAELERRRAGALAAAAAPATTSDGTAVRVACNVGSLDDDRAGEGAGIPVGGPEDRRPTRGPPEHSLAAGR